MSKFNLKIIDLLWLIVSKWMYGLAENQWITEPARLCVYQLGNKLCTLYNKQYMTFISQTYKNKATKYVHLKTFVKRQRPFVVCGKKVVNSSTHKFVLQKKMVCEYYPNLVIIVVQKRWNFSRKFILWEFTFVETEKLRN